MKRSLACFLFIIISLNAYNQVIGGTVLNNKDKKPIEGASVFFNGTFIGAYTDQEGHFKLDVSKNKNMPLTVSAMGFYSVSLTQFSSGKPIFVYMVPRVFELSEVVISDKDLSKIRKRNLRIFKDEFLGTTFNAVQSKIINEEDIKFVYNLKSDTVMAYSSNPIIVENNALGYKITYFLDEFEYDKRRRLTFFAGNILFNEDLTLSDEQKRNFEKKRELAYNGSRMHFFRALWADDLDSSGFMVRNNSGKLLSYSDLVTEEDSSLKYFHYDSDLIIYYKSAESSGEISFIEDEVYFDQNGYFNPRGIQWSGLISDFRIADWLPYEYALDKKTRGSVH
ncbi:MAG TPA: carboxypeptidase-like regulatory domain-containing protein [Bacteroidales bacterium]|nr:carboxypeptidase-like regulatory domain-containing protein [Bacteroidales bacterium]